VRGIRSVALATTLIVSMGATAAVAAAQSGSEKPKATEVGVTDTEIHIAVLADVDNTIRPGLFKGAQDAGEAWAGYINNSCKTKNKCVAGRKIVVDFIDTKLNPNETRNAIITACQNDYALVGTTSIFMNEGAVSDLVGCTDQAGAATGLPDFAALSTDPGHQCAPTTHPVNPPALICDTREQSPQTYQANTGPTNRYLKQNKGKLGGVFLLPSDIKQARDSQLPLFAGQEQVGIKQLESFDVRGAALQPEYTPIVQAINDKKATYVRSGLDYQSTVLLRREAKAQGATSVKVWDCSLQCYDPRLLSEGGADVDGEYVNINFVPFEEAKANKNLAAMLKAVEDPDSFSTQTWAAATYFRDAVNAVVKKDGVNGITRSALLTAMTGINGFTADGMIAAVDVGSKTLSDCYALLQVKNGKFARVFPTKPATFSCDPKNRVEVKMDIS
jgi:Periplasmic binding protein